MRILILGKGFLGTRIFNYLNKHYNVEIYSQKELNYTEPYILNSYLDCRYNKFDVIINASGYTGNPNIDVAEDDKITCWRYNVTVPCGIVGVCNKLKIPLIQISSGCVYNGYVKKYAEFDIPNFGLFNNESSFYSKTKHAAETLIKDKCWLFRIRMPFCVENVSRNYFCKILKYDNLISLKNSMTCVDDFCEFISSFLKRKDDGFCYGMYNVVNEGSIDAKEIVEMLAEFGIKNSNHKFILESELKTKAKRSNCILSTELIKSYGLELPEVRDSIRKSIIKFKEVYDG